MGLLFRSRHAGHSSQSVQAYSVLLLITLGMFAGCATAGNTRSATSPLAVPDYVDGGRPAAQLLILGVFHFANPGLDTYKQQFGIDMLAPEHQRDIVDVAAALERFRPTRVAVEQDLDQQQRLDSLYAEYVAGRYVLKSNEIYQLGFRIAKELGLPRVYAVDANGRRYAEMTQAAYRAHVDSLGQLDRLHTVWDERFTRLYRYDDSLKTATHLGPYLRYLNDPERIRIGHGHYLVSDFTVGNGEDYLGPDGATAWYNRNLRIFNNLQRITESPSDRILLIVGAGHLPILRFLAQASPEYRFVDPRDYLPDR